MDPPLRDNLVRSRGNLKKGSNNTRRVWSSREEQTLILALSKLVANGWKSENGFRTGYLLKLEDALKTTFPTTDLVANPHICSKLTSWKKSYASLVTAQKDTTGVGFNMTTNQLEVTDDQWEQIVQKDPTMRGMRHKEWPFFKDWLEIFGKDRATGDVAEEVGVAADTMLKKRERQKDVNHECDEEHHINMEESTPVDIGVNKGEDNGSTNTSYTKETAQPSVSNSRRKKRRGDSGDDKLVDVLVDYCRATGERLENIGKRIGHDHDLGEARKNLFSQLGNIPGLSLCDKLDVTTMLGANPNQLEIFMGYPDEARAVYVNRLLKRETF